jgi:hypothetical protein
MSTPTNVLLLHAIPDRYYFATWRRGFSTPGPG